MSTYSYAGVQSLDLNDDFDPLFGQPSKGPSQTVEDDSSDEEVTPVKMKAKKKGSSSASRSSSSVAVDPDLVDTLLSRFRKQELSKTLSLSIRKRIDNLKEQQRHWMVIPSGFQELEFRNGHEAYGVNIHLRECMFRMWQLYGIPCVHSVAAYSHMNKDPVEGVDQWVKIRGKGGKGDGNGGRVKAVLVVVVWVKEVMAMKDDEIINYLEHKYMEEVLLQEEEKREAQQKAKQELLNEEALRLTLKKEARYEKEEEERLRELREEYKCDMKHDYFYPSN
nr:zinc finger, PMZ-type [Tanacetum cinerariifolium]